MWVLETVRRVHGFFSNLSKELHHCSSITSFSYVVYFHIQFLKSMPLHPVKDHLSVLPFLLIWKLTSSKFWVWKIAGRIKRSTCILVMFRKSRCYNSNWHLFENLIAVMFISGFFELFLICCYCWVNLTCKTYVLCSYVLIILLCAFVICCVFQFEKVKKKILLGGKAFLFPQNFIFRNTTSTLYAISKKAK